MKLSATLLGFLGVTVTPAIAQPSTDCAPARNETVVLLHGLGRTNFSMLPLAHALERQGYKVINVSYPWRTQSLERLASEWLPAQLAAETDAQRIHFVTHSMGGILVRLWLREHGAPANLGRVVMLAPPNSGSELPEPLTRFAPFRWILGPNARLLGTSSTHLPRALGAWPEPETDLAVIAGTRSLHPLFDGWLPRPHDGIVSVASTHLTGEREHIVLPFSHTWLGWRHQTIAHVIAFLRDGSFFSSAA